MSAETDRARGEWYAAQAALDKVRGDIKNLQGQIEQAQYKSQDLERSRNSAYQQYTLAAGRDQEAARSLVTKQAWTAVQTCPITYVNVDSVMTDTVLEALASTTNLGSWGDNDLTLIECRNLIERLKDLIADVRQHPEETELFVEAADALRNLQALPAGTYVNLEL